MWPAAGPPTSSRARNISRAAPARDWDTYRDDLAQQGQMLGIPGIGLHRSADGRRSLDPPARTHPIVDSARRRPRPNPVRLA